MIERGGVIGAALDAWMLQPGWIRGETTQRDRSRWTRSPTTSTTSASSPATRRHAAIGTDLDGGYGTEQTPATSTPSPTSSASPTCSARRGYADADIDAIMHGNWLRFFREAWSG